MRSGIMSSPVCGGKHFENRVGIKVYIKPYIKAYIKVCIKEGGDGGKSYCFHYSHTHSPTHPIRNDDSQVILNTCGTEAGQLYIKVYITRMMTLCRPVPARYSDDLGRIVLSLNQSDVEVWDVIFGGL
jgi:hypothetical protein